MPRHDDDFEDDDRPRRRPRRNDDDDFRDGPPPKKSGGSLTLILILVGVFVVCCGGVGAVGLFAFRGAQRVVHQAVEVQQDGLQAEESRQNLVQIGTAIHKYHDAMNVIPNNSYEVRGKESRPLLSWRVHLLPYLGEDRLYKQFNLKEPWDSATNKPLIGQMPTVYKTSGPRNKNLEGTTFYRGFNSKGAIFEQPIAGNPPLKFGFAGITDGTSNTILVVEAGEAVEWTKPDDIDWVPGRPRPPLGGPSTLTDTFWALMGDGSVMPVRKAVTDQTLRDLIGREDGKIIPAGWHR